MTISDCDTGKLGFHILKIPGPGWKFNPEPQLPSNEARPNEPLRWSNYSLNSNVLKVESNYENFIITKLVSRPEHLLLTKKLSFSRLRFLILITNYCLARENKQEIYI